MTYIKSPRLSQEDLQLLFDCVLFSASTNACWADDIRCDEAILELIQKFGCIGWKGSEPLTLFKGDGKYEEPEISKYIEEMKILKTK